MRQTLSQFFFSFEAQELCAILNFTFDSNTIWEIEELAVFSRPQISLIPGTMVLAQSFPHTCIYIHLCVSASENMVISEVFSSIHLCNKTR